jgi:saccharopine dehydrogenase-like NADP-dependent oxidoreductase
MRAESILIAGGYGVVGQRIVADLAEDYPVVVAGRHIDKANAIATAIGRGVAARELDVTNQQSIAAALDKVSGIVSCIDQPGRRLLHEAIARGLMYTDITPHLTELGRGAEYERLRRDAAASGAQVVLGTGIVPGISNVIVRALANKLGGAESISTSLLLSAHDQSGPASMTYLAKELTMPFDRYVNGRDHPAAPFSEPVRVEFPLPFGERDAYLFPFSDQVLYPVTMEAKTVETRLAVDPPRLARLLAVILRLGAARFIEARRVRQTLLQLRRQPGTDDAPKFALRVDVKCGNRSASATLVGIAQADAAAAGAVCTIRALVDGSVGPGVWMPEQVLNEQTFFSRLAERGFQVHCQGSSETSIGDSPIC